MPDDARLPGDAGGRPFAGGWPFAGPTAGARGREPDSAAAAGPFPGRASTAGEPADNAAGEPPGQAGGGHVAHIQTRPGGRSGSHAPAPGVLAKVAGRVKSAVAGGGSLLRPRGGGTPAGHARVVAAGAADLGAAEAGAQESALAGDPVTRRTLAVWGPIGSPGRTLLAVNMAGELAARGQRVMLVDADSYGASVAASLGLLDESASFAQACRVADQGLLTVAELARICSEVVCAGGTFSLLTGLTRSDRWPELRAAAVERVLQTARTMVDTVVIDCGFCLETDEELSYDTVAPRRNAATLAALAQADTIYAVGSADAVGIPRLIRALADLTEACAGSEVRVVLNKVRKKSAGGSPVKALEDAWQRFGPALPIGHVLPWDPDVPARALLEGQLLQELAPDSALRRAIRDICCAPVQGNHRTAVLSATARPGNPG
ncbi:chromosome partitioning protein [Arthrobacter sp. AETb3-4]|uniref:Chromosome partitioning protein n=1 Tax=Arthrobacter wenxiniae TaxID=2713570 RepID=A0A7Y7IHS2_9MICC|nr:chromosome partitioning protein [Arthrobacter wenxiniae]